MSLPVYVLLNWTLSVTLGTVRKLVSIGISIKFLKPVMDMSPARVFRDLLPAFRWRWVTAIHGAYCAELFYFI